MSLCKIYHVILFFSFSVLGVFSHYRKVYLEDSCTNNETLRMYIDANDANSAAILKASRNATFLPNRNCTVYIIPPLGFGIVLSVRYLNMNPYEEPLCENYILIKGAEGSEKNIFLCGHSDDDTEFQSYDNTGPLNLFFHTENPTHAQSDFTFVITTFLNPLFDCPVHWFRCENRRCIWKGLTCDGHNNCGDQSDESPHSPSRCGKFEISVGGLIGVIVGSIFMFLLLVVLPILYCCIRSKKRGLICEERRRIIQDSVRNERVIENPRHPNEGEASSYNIPNTSSGLDNNNISQPQSYHEPPPVYKP